MNDNGLSGSKLEYEQMSSESEGHLPPAGSGKKLVVMMVIIVFAVSSFAALYGLHLRSKMPHSEADHDHSQHAEEEHEHEEGKSSESTSTSETQ